MTTPTPVVEGSDVLGAAVRRLVDTVVRTQADPQDVRAAAHAVDQVTASLSGLLRSGPHSPDRADPGANPFELRYLAPTPLHTDLVTEARLVTVDGRKVHIEGTISAGGTTTVRATGPFLALDRSTAAALFPHLAAG